MFQSSSKCNRLFCCYVSAQRAFVCTSWFLLAPNLLLSLMHYVLGFENFRLRFAFTLSLQQGYTQAVCVRIMKRYLVCCGVAGVYRRTAIQMLVIISPCYVSKNHPRKCYRQNPYLNCVYSVSRYSAKATCWCVNQLLVLDGFYRYYSLFFISV